MSRKSRQDAARDDQAAVIDGLVHVGLADGLRGLRRHRGLDRVVNLALLLGLDVTGHAVLRVVDRLLDLRGGVERVDALAERADDEQVRDSEQCEDKAGEGKLANPFGQIEVLVADDHRGRVDRHNRGEREPAERQIVHADATGRLGDLLVHLRTELRGRVRSSLQERQPYRPPKPAWPLVCNSPRADYSFIIRRSTGIITADGGCA